MTRDEWNSTMTRWLHRNDIAADLDTVFAFASTKVAERLMRTPPSDFDALVSTPRMITHAGLMHLHELVQDDDGIMREQSLFEVAAQDEAFRWSLDNVTPDMFAQETQ